MSGLLLDRFAGREGERAHRAELDAERLAGTPGAEVALEDAVVALAVVDGVVGTRVDAGAAADAVCFGEPDDTTLVHCEGAAGAGVQALRRIAVPTDADAEAILGHVLLDSEPGQARCALAFVVQRAREDAGLAVAAEIIADGYGRYLRQV